MTCFRHVLHTKLSGHFTIPNQFLMTVHISSIHRVYPGPKVSLTIRSSICNVNSAKDVRDAFSVIQVTTIKLNPSPPGTAEMENIKRPKRPKYRYRYHSLFDLI
ncbi:uncharacterized protein EAF02_004313 [Botrytis sinoallii]|uniref:uncharacterized protein n=1 Tax=Botrytis sinoallii TaxID=1463999 RepID=UPI00190176BA|nr:uncharacterized protein EAF02_004313 [Botrytis sinoallii]KAF7885804.1 hypothetical protein EAF02_004313 [Botrytis sinoallii]